VIPDPLSLRNPDWTFIAWSTWVALNIMLFIFIKVKHPMAKASQRKAMDFIFYDVVVFGSAIAINIALWMFYPENHYAYALWGTLRFNLIIFPYLGLWVVLLAFFSDIYRASRSKVDYRIHSVVFLIGLGVAIFLYLLL
jgi:hypothetical protein